MRIELISLHQDTSAAAAALTLPPNVSIHRTDVLALPTAGRIFVSPANSLGFMDGGIDDVYRRKIFPRCDRVVRQLITELGHRTELGRPYLRVGSACWQRISSETALISAPTMFLPHDVSSTRNAYWAMMAALMAADKIRAGSGGECLHTMVVPFLCCGWGRMPITVSLSQMLEAIQDWSEGRMPTETEDRGPYYVILPSRDTEQPSNFDNREIGIPWGAAVPGLNGATT